MISTRVGGIAEIYGPTAPSLIAPNDAAALRVAMQNAIDRTEDTTAEMLVRLEHVGAHFSLANMAGSVEGLYYSLLAKA